MTKTPKTSRPKKRLRRRDVERLENTSLVAAALGPSDACTCADASQVSIGCAQSSACDDGSCGYQSECAIASTNGA